MNFRERPRIVALVGPTGAGKTDLGLEVGQRLGAEIVGADSRQVYRRLDIGSAKPTLAQRALVHHHLIDVVDPDQPFNCAEFRRLAQAAIDDILRRGKRVLVIGGTGLYVKALKGGLFAGPGPDPGLRAALARAEDAEPGTLHRRLSAVDPPAAARLHPHDRVRLIRAIEVYEATGRPISEWQRAHGFGDTAFDMLLLAVALPRTELYARIDARCESMLRQGLIEEVASLYASGIGAELPAMRSPGYREIGEYVRGLCDLPSARARMAQATRHLAKRQMTWLRGTDGIVWNPPDAAELARQAEVFWETPRP